MKKTIFLICLSTFASIYVFGQQFYFANRMYSDSVALAKALPGLAKQLIENYRKPDKENYYDNLFRFQIVAEQYDDALKSIHQVRATSTLKDSLRAMGIAFQYETYTITKGTQIKMPNLFEIIYPEIFTKLYHNLNERATPLVEYYFKSDLNEIASNWHKQCSDLQAKGKDSITMEDAKLLCRSWNSYNVYSKILPLGKQLLAKVNNFIVEDSTLITMNDGAIISAVIVRKKDITKPQPVVLVYNIYAGSIDIGKAEEIAVHGFIGVVVNTRGKRLSPQQIAPFEYDAKDAYEIIDWISKQPWCNGKVGMFGGSYLGFSQWAAVKYLHPALKTIVPQVSVGAGIDYPLSNGIFMSYMLRWIHYVTNNKMTDEDEFGNQDKWNNLFTKWYKSGTSFRSFDKLDSRPDFIFQRWLKHPSYDSYWQSMTPQKAEFAKINIPILTITGYYDDDQLGALYYYRQHHLWNKKANKNHYLLIGPFNHGGSQGYPRSILTNYKIDSVANISITDIVFNWFDYVLKDSSKPAILKDYINFEVMGKNEWRHVASLDKMNNDTLTFYLSTSKDGNRYKLASSKSLKTGHISQEVNFLDRHEIKLDGEDLGWVNAIIDSVLVPSQNQLVFITDPLKERFSINGAIMANIVTAINKKDMDIVLDFYEQMPDGKYFALNRCLQRASYAKDRVKRQLLHPGKMELIEMNNTFFTSRQLQKGSRLVIIIGINKNPDWQINYGTGKDVSDETINDAKIPLEIKWYNNSSIKIPVWKQ